MRHRTVESYVKTIIRSEDTNITIQQIDDLVVQMRDRLNDLLEAGRLDGIDLISAELRIMKKVNV